MGRESGGWGGRSRGGGGWCGGGDGGGGGGGVGGTTSFCLIWCGTVLCRGFVVLACVVQRRLVDV